MAKQCEDYNQDAKWLLLLFRIREVLGTTVICNP
jgi:hypothetical protein